MKSILLFICLGTIVFSDVNVITSKKNNFNLMSQKTISNIYLKKMTTINNKKIIPIDNMKDTDEFYNKVVHKTPNQIHAY